jgi:hypothetical protein
MAIRLTSTVNKISSMPNSANLMILRDFYAYMHSNSTSEKNQNQNLKSYHWLC